MDCVRHFSSKDSSGRLDLGVFRSERHQYPPSDHLPHFAGFFWLESFCACAGTAGRPIATFTEPSVAS